MSTQERVESLYAVLAVLKHRESRILDVERKSQIRQQIALTIMAIVEAEQEPTDEPRLR